MAATSNEDSESLQVFVTCAAVQSVHRHVDAPRPAQAADAVAVRQWNPRKPRRLQWSVMFPFLFRFIRRLAYYRYYGSLIAD